MVTKQNTLDAVEKVIDVVDETVDTLERVPTLAINGTTKKQQIVILTATALVSAAAGAGAAYLITKKLLVTKYDAELERQIEASRKFYGRLHKTDEDLETPTAMVERLGYKPVEDVALPAKTGNEFVNPIPDSVIPVAPEPENVNVFEAFPSHDFDYEAEVAKRTKDEPYIITSEEYLSGEREYDQEFLTFYEGDGELADHRDELVDDPDRTVGIQNLQRFGAASNDANMVYVRNDRMEMDFEIARSIGDYAQEVHGLKRAPGKFRG